MQDSAEMPGKRQFLYKAEIEGQTVEQRLLTEGYSKRLIIALKQTEDGLFVAGGRVRSTYKMKAGETLVVTLPQEQVVRAKSDTPVPVLYEDDDIIVYNKPAGMVCHRSGSHFDDTLENTASGIFRAMSRLDRDTSGALVTAKHQLSAALLWQRIEKRYIAVVQGELAQSHGIIEMPISRQMPYEPRQIVSEEGKPAETEYRVLAKNTKLTVVSCKLHTGRMHQIRVHFSAIGHPLAGDEFYGGNTNGIARQALHCQKVIFSHPITHKRLCLSAPLAQDIVELIAKNGLCIDEAGSIE